MVTPTKSSERWSNPECPAGPKITKEIFPPAGISRLLPNHFRWWRKPFVNHWWPWWHQCSCCCCCDKTPAPTNACMINLQLEPNIFGPGRSIHIVAGPGVYFAEFYVDWTTTGTSGQATVDLELISGPVATPQLLADNRGPNDHYLFGTRVPGSYLFRATATDAQGNTCFDTLQVDVPAI